MKRYLLLLLLLPSIAFAATLLDSFGTNVDLTVGDWDGGYGVSRVCTATGGHVLPTTIGTACLATWITNTYSGDQGAQISITVLTDGAGDAARASLLLRANPSTDRTWYRCLGYTGNYPTPGSVTAEIQRVVSGTATTLTTTTSGGGFAPGDVLKCTITGTSTVTIKIFKNNVEVLSATDGTPLTGDRIGLSCYAVDTLDQCQIDDFSTGDIAAPPASTRRRVVVVQ